MIRPKFPFPDQRFRKFQFSGQNHSCTHTEFRDVLFFKTYKLWDNLDRFGPVTIVLFPYTLILHPVATTMYLRICYWVILS